MKTWSTYDLISDLYVGYIPYTEDIKLKDFLQQPEIKKALGEALEAMERFGNITYRQWVPVNAGQKWSEEEEQRLVVAFDRFLSVNTLAAIHQRTEEAIRDRLILLGKG
jgi:hypothetical protein